MGILKKKIEKFQTTGQTKKFPKDEYFKLAYYKPTKRSMQLVGGVVNNQKDPYSITGLLRKGDQYSWNMVTPGGHVEPGFVPDSTRQSGDTTYIWFTPKNTGSKTIKIIPDDKKFNAVWNQYFEGKSN